MKRLLILLLLLFPFVGFCETADVSVCFTPGNRCDERLINEINSAKHTIDVQAYQLTSPLIEIALANASQLGVKVVVILDKSQLRGKYPSAIYFRNMGVPTWIDNKVRIAHNKVMIIDGKEVITGSYNYSKAAQYSNAENMVIIHSTEIAAQYQKNFESRLLVSEKIQ